ncbi:MAG: hypothetical protein NT067_02535 [Candidatus Diapherotrites archaeon]|nr:hypothetical protein [Candidatus Diapherotrites archaeon]
MADTLSHMKPYQKILLALVVGFSVVSFWRGVWGLLDHYLLPEDPVLSLWVSVIMGATILTVTGFITKIMA